MAKSGQARRIDEATRRRQEAARRVARKDRVRTFVVASDARGLTPPMIAFWTGPGAPEWSERREDAIGFASLALARLAGEVLAHEGQHPGGWRTGCDVVVIEDYGLPTERTHKIGEEAR